MKNLKYWMEPIPYFILIAFILLGAYTEEIYTTTKIIIDNQNKQLSQANRTINLITTHRTKPESYLFTNPVHPDDYLRITSPYGYRELVNPFTGGTRESIHKGVDYLGTHKARIVSIGSGKVIEHYPPPDSYYKGHEILGGMIKIDHGNGWTSVYGHLSGTYVKEGQIVNAGDIIGRQGNTGLSYGDHLHFELQYNNETVQPLKFVGGPNDL